MTGNDAAAFLHESIACDEMVIVTDDQDQAGRRGDLAVLLAIIGRRGGDR